MESESPGAETEVQGLPVYVGEYVHSMDPKKRLTIPAVWRVQVGKPNSFYVLPDFHVKCLNLYPAAEMTHKLEKLRRHSMGDPKAMEFARILGGASDLVSWDQQGRIRIKDKLLEFANLDEQVVMIGALNKIQLWSPANRPDAGQINQTSLAEAGRYVDF